MTWFSATKTTSFLKSCLVLYPGVPLLEAGGLVKAQWGSEGTTWGFRTDEATAVKQYSAPGSR